MLYLPVEAVTEMLCAGVFINHCAIFFLNKRNLKAWLFFKGIEVAGVSTISISVCMFLTKA